MWQRNLAVLWFANFSLMAGMSLVMPFLPLYIQQLGVHGTKATEMWAGLVFASNFVTAALFSPFWGRISDRFGRKPLLLRSAFGIAMITFIMGLVQNVQELLALRLLMGVVAGFIPAAIALVATSTPKERVGYALGILQTGSVSGSIIGPLFGGFLADWVGGLREIFFITTGLNVIAALIVFFLVHENFQPAKNPNPLEKAKRGLGALRGQGPLLAMFAVTFLLQFSMMNVEPILTLFLKHLDPTTMHLALYSGIVFSVTGFANILASPKLGKLGDRIGQKKILLVSLTGAGLMYLLQFFAQNIPEMIMIRFILGLTFGGLLPSVNVLIRKYAPAHLQGTAYGFNTSAMFVGNFFGPLFGGFVASNFGIRMIFPITTFLFLLNVVWLLFGTKESTLTSERTAT